MKTQEKDKKSAYDVELSKTKMPPKTTLTRLVDSASMKNQTAHDSIYQKDVKETVLVKIKNKYNHYFINNKYYSAFRGLTDTLEKDKIDLATIGKTVNDVKAFSNFTKIYNNSLMNKGLSSSKEIKELLHDIDEKALENVSKPRRELIQFLKKIYSDRMGGA